MAIKEKQEQIQTLVEQWQQSDYSQREFPEFIRSITTKNTEGKEKNSSQTFVSLKISSYLSFVKLKTGNIAGNRQHGGAYDTNGKLTYASDEIWQSERRLCWDEENRLGTVKDREYLSSYLYNAGGQLVWKFTGPIVEMSQSGNNTVEGAKLTGKTLYDNPYMVVTDENYTKHYYTGSERITSKIGSGFALAPVHPLDYELGQLENNQGYFPYDNYEAFGQALWDMMGKVYECAGLEPENVSFTPGLACMEELAEDRGEEHQIYFYHPDHIGSSSFITDASGAAHQHLQYLPYGEDFIDQRAGWNTRYTFSAKEKDKKTGYHYFGARYYDSERSQWLSVDPMAEKYPYQSPYSYVGNRPTTVIDPNGMSEWIPPSDGSDEWTAEKGDGAETLAKDAEISREKAYKLMEEQGHGTYRDPEDGVLKSDVDPGDVVNVPSSKNNSGQSNSGQSNNTSNNSSNTNKSESNVELQEKVVTQPTPYFNISVSKSTKVKDANSNKTMIINRKGKFTGMSFTDGFMKTTLKTNSLTVGQGPISTGLDHKRGSFLINVSTPTINNQHYNVELSFNKQQAKMSAKTIMYIIMFRKAPKPKLPKTPKPNLKPAPAY